MKLNKAAAEVLKSSKPKPMSKRKTTTHNEKAKPCSMQPQPQNRLLTKDDTEKSFNDNDIRNSIPDFQPHHEPGQHLDSDPSNCERSRFFSTILYRRTYC